MSQSLEISSIQKQVESGASFDPVAYNVVFKSVRNLMCWIMLVIFKYFVENGKGYGSYKQRWPTKYFTKHGERTWFCSISYTFYFLLFFS